jgi:membrane protein implicated in regulation of membrane protease activity
MDDIATVLGSIDRYWRETGVPSHAITEMRLELEQHLAQATGEGRTLEHVVGADVPGFAESWAAEHRRRKSTTATWQEVQTGRARRTRQTKREMTLVGLGSAAMVAAAAVAGQGGNEVEVEIWRWLWTGFAAVMAIGEIFTAGFFLLPFAIGAGGAAVLAWVGAGILAQWLVFFGLSIVSLVYLQRFIRRQDEEDQPKVGANRWVGEVGLVLEEIDPKTGDGMVRILREEWRASAPQVIPAGERIVVTDVQGARLIVELLEN